MCKAATADDGYEHVFLKRLHDQDASETWRRVSVGAQPGMKCMADEVFGPVLAVATFSTEARVGQ